MSISEEKQSPPGGPAVEHQKIGMPPPTNFQQNSGASIASAMSQGGGLLGLSKGPVTEAELAKARNELLWGSSPVMANSEPASSSLAQKRAQCSSGVHEWDHKTHRCIHCQTPVTSFMLQASAVDTVPAPSHWVYPTSIYVPNVQKISQRQNPDPGWEEREIDRLRDVVAELRAQNAAQATLIASMSGEQVADTDGLFKARVEASAVAAVDEPVNVEKAAQDTIDAMVNRRLSRGMTEKLRDTAVESLRKGDRDASVGRAIGARFGGGLRQPW